MKRMHAQDRGHHDYILPLGLKGSNDVLSIDAFVILFRFPIYILYFIIYYYTIVVKGYFSIKTS